MSATCECALFMPSLVGVSMQYVCGGKIERTNKKRIEAIYVCISSKGFAQNPRTSQHQPAEIRWCVAAWSASYPRRSTKICKWASRIDPVQKPADTPPPMLPAASSHSTAGNVTLIFMRISRRSRGYNDIHESLTKSVRHVVRIHAIGAYMRD